MSWVPNKDTIYFAVGFALSMLPSAVMGYIAGSVSNANTKLDAIDKKLDVIMAQNQNVSKPS